MIDIVKKVFLEYQFKESLRNYTIILIHKMMFINKSHCFLIQFTCPCCRLIKLYVPNTLNYLHNRQYSEKHELMDFVNGKTCFLLKTLLEIARKTPCASRRLFLLDIFFFFLFFIFFYIYSRLHKSRIFLSTILILEKDSK